MCVPPIYRQIDRQIEIRLRFLFLTIYRWMDVQIDRQRGDSGVNPITLEIDKSIQIQVELQIDIRIRFFFLTLRPRARLGALAYLVSAIQSQDVRASHISMDRQIDSLRFECIPLFDLRVRGAVAQNALSTQFPQFNLNLCVPPIDGWIDRYLFEFESSSFSVGVCVCDLLICLPQGQGRGSEPFEQAQHFNLNTSVSPIDRQMDRQIDRYLFEFNSSWLTHISIDRLTHISIDRQVDSYSNAIACFDFRARGAALSPLSRHSDGSGVRIRRCKRRVRINRYICNK